MTEVKAKKVILKDKSGNYLIPYTETENIANGFSLFDIKMSDHILTGDEALGWALQGSLITMTYPNAVNKIKELYNSGSDVEYRGITCKKSIDGRYIADISHKTAIDTLFENSGVADFYILDSANNQFYLPKSKWFQQLCVDSSLANIYNEAGIPNLYYSNGQGVGGSITGNVLKHTSTQYNCAVASGSANIGTQTFNASYANPVYGKSETVQPISSNKLLYYKVGNTVVNETEIDMGNVLVDLQKFKEQLDQKVNVDSSNLTFPYIKESYTNGVSGYRIWSDNYKEQWGRQGVSSRNAATIIFLKSFKNSDYWAQITGITGTNVTAANSNRGALINLATGQMTIQQAEGYYTYSWVAAGY